MDNQKQLIEEGQAMQRPKEKCQDDNNDIQNMTRKTND